MRLGNLILMSMVGFFSLPAAPCTGIQFGAGKSNTIAQNIGWYWAIDGAFVINPRNMSKQGVALFDSDPTAQWISKYGSVSFSPGGREYPISGINEKGLVVQGLQYLVGRYPTAQESKLPSLQAFQWIQYQLDLSKNVQEAIANAKAVRPTGQKPLLLHYMVCDSGGECANFEYSQDGELKIYSGARLPKNISTNSSYPESLAMAQQCSINRSCTPPDDSLNRFVLAAKLAENYVASGDSLNYGLYSLGVVQQMYPLTLWNLVIQNGDAGHLRFN